jgi:hypothetical protein
MPRLRILPPKTPTNGYPFVKDCSMTKEQIEKLNKWFQERVFPIEHGVEVTCEKPTKSCNHPNKYLNKISSNLQFWVCPDCKEEV